MAQVMINQPQFSNKYRISAEFNLLCYNIICSRLYYLDSNSTKIRLYVCNAYYMYVCDANFPDAHIRVVTGKTTVSIKPNLMHNIHCPEYYQPTLQNFTASL